MSRVTHAPLAKRRDTIASIVKLGRRAERSKAIWRRRKLPRSVVEQTLEKFGQIDILINNAGMIRRAPAVDYTEDDWSTVIQVNLSSVFRLSQAAGER
jgi:2-deoxy-D-gluconate 3-dehydrogenase